MDIQFFDNNDQVPQPPEKVRIEGLQVQVYPDRRRVWIEIKVTPFQQRPNLILAARDTEGRLAGELDIIETMHAKMEFVMHLRVQGDPAGHYTLTTDLFYENKNPPQDRHTVEFDVPEAE